MTDMTSLIPKLHMGPGNEDMITTTEYMSDRLVWQILTRIMQ